MINLFKTIKVGDYVRINSNCVNTRKPIFKVYGVLKNEEGTFYLIFDERGLNKRLFNKEELIKVKGLKIK